MKTRCTILISPAARLALVLSLVLSGCASHPPPPDWVLEAEAALGAHTRDWFAGRDDLAGKSLSTARRAVARTGDASQMARVELHACAVHAASLQLDGCPAFQALAVDTGAQEKSYAAYLSGDSANIQADHLPERQRKAWRTPARIAEIDDPLSRLVASAVQLQAGQLTPEGIALAIETAARQGWRRPLLAWLKLEQERLKRLGDSTGEAAIARRIERVLGEKP